MVKAYNIQLIEDTSNFLENQKERNQLELEEYFLLNPLTPKIRLINGERVIIESIDVYGKPVYIASESNRDGAITIGANHLYSGGSLGLDINGEGIEVITWDSGYARVSHQEFQGRARLGESGAQTSDHSTHVGGTLVAGGLNLSVRGIAHKANLASLDFDNDITEMNQQAASGLLISNHSYGRVVNIDTDVAYFGKYDEIASAYDRIAYSYPNYLPVLSAGNDRNDGYNIKDNGYDLLTDRSVSKNGITVGAVEKVSNYSGPSSIIMSSFSSWGPTDDGRIKPDLVAMGVDVNSLGSNSNTDIDIKSGTSMSAPMITGGILLLQQLFNNQENRFMRSATAKGIALMTTNEAGDFPGPDYRFGWGLMNLQAAAKMITEKDYSSFIEEKELANNTFHQETISAANSNKMTIALSWTDLPSQQNDNSEDESTPMLVHDLDLKVTSSEGVEFFPYKLDGKNPSAAATRGINNADNIEIVVIDNPIGDYVVKISHKNRLFATQNYSLLANGGTIQTASVQSNQESNFNVFPNPANNFLQIVLHDHFRGEDSWIEIFNVQGQLMLKKKLSPYRIPRRNSVT